MSSSFWIALSTAANQVVSFVVFVVIARLVTPAEFGLVTLAAVVIELFQIVATAGIADAVIQRESLDERVADTAFWMNIAFGVASSAIILALASPIQTLFGVAGLSHIVRILALTFVIAPFGGIHAARLARDFGFRTLAIRNFAATLMSGVIGVAIAAEGGGASALVAQRLVAVATTSVIGFFSYPWWPRLRFDRHIGGELAVFGAKIMGSQLLLTSNVRGVELIAGFVLGPTGIATIRVANRCIDMMVALTIMPFQQVALPYLSRLQGSPSAMRRGYTVLSRAAALVVYPVFAIAFALAPKLVPALFGPQWAPAGDVMQILCFAVIPLHFNILLPATLAANGLPGQVFGWSAAQLALGLGAAAIGASFGVFGLVLGNLLRAYALLPLGVAILGRKTGIFVATVLGSVAGPLAISAMVAGLVSAVVALAGTSFNVWVLLATGGAVGALAYVALVLIFMREDLELAAGLLPRRFERVLAFCMRRMPASAAWRKTT